MNIFNLYFRRIGRKKTWDINNIRDSRGSYRGKKTGGVGDKESLKSKITDLSKNTEITNITTVPLKAALTNKKPNSEANDNSSESIIEYAIFTLLRIHENSKFLFHCDTFYFIYIYKIFLKNDFFLLISKV